jgi:putative transposase
MRTAFKYRLYPNKQQEQTLLFFLRRCRELYNSGLEERQAAYQMRRVSVRCFDQINELASPQARLSRLSRGPFSCAARCLAAVG